MKKRLVVYRNTIEILWRSLSIPVRSLIILFALTFLAILVFSDERGLWLILCGGLFGVGGLSAYIIYRLIFSERKL
jgi:hypothetical protein